MNILREKNLRLGQKPQTLNLKYMMLNVQRKKYSPPVLLFHEVLPNRFLFYFKWVNQLIRMHHISDCRLIYFKLYYLRFYFLRRLKFAKQSNRKHQFSPVSLEAVFHRISISFLGSSRLIADCYR